VQGEIKAMVFDLDGTLYVNGDLGREISLSACCYIAELRGVSVAEAEELIRGARQSISAETCTETTLSRTCLKLGGDLHELHRRLGEEIRPERFLTRDERVVKLLRVLGSRFELFIYTNNNRRLSARIMESIGVAGLFRQVLTIEDFWQPKPDRGALEKIFATIGRKPAECLFVGDRYDIDLRLPAAMGSAVFLATSAEELFPLAKLLHEENL
jgi:putative hydrolase of the HAD superfamily